jgi:hypothetical protein
MDKELKDEFKKINSQIEILAATINNDVAKKEDLENFATKDDLKKLEEKIIKIDKKIDNVSADVQIQKNVPIIRKVDNKVNKHIEIHYQRKNITEKDLEEIKKLDPFPGKPIIAQP